MSVRAPVGPKPRPGDKKRRIALQELYAELPEIECRQLCAQACGPVFMSRIEWQSVCRAVGEERKAEASLEVLVARMEAGDIDAKALDHAVTCPILENGLCAAYDVRPMICRLWGIVETMPCKWGCKPERYLTKEEGFEFLARAREIDQ